MKLIEDRETEVFSDEDDVISIIQPTECSSCGESLSACVTFSAHRARLIASELLRLADEIEPE